MSLRNTTRNVKYREEEEEEEVEWFDEVAINSDEEASSNDEQHSKRKKGKNKMKTKKQDEKRQDSRYKETKKGTPGKSKGPSRPGDGQDMFEDSDIAEGNVQEKVSIPSQLVAVNKPQNVSKKNRQEAVEPEPVVAMRHSVVGIPIPPGAPKNLKNACYKCMQRFADINSYKRHLIMNHNADLFECKHSCGMTFYNCESQRKHEKLYCPFRNKLQDADKFVFTGLDEAAVEEDFREVYSKLAPCVGPKPAIELMTTLVKYKASRNEVYELLQRVYESDTEPSKEQVENAVEHFKMMIDERSAEASASETVKGKGTKRSAPKATPGGRPGPASKKRRTDGQQNKQSSIDEFEQASVDATSTQPSTSKTIALYVAQKKSTTSSGHTVSLPPTKMGKANQRASGSYKKKDGNTKHHSSEPKSKSKKRHESSSESNDSLGSQSDSSVQSTKSTRVSRQTPPRSKRNVKGKDMMPFTKDSSIRPRDSPAQATPRMKNLSINLTRVNVPAKTNQDNQRSINNHPQLPLKVPVNSAASTTPSSKKTLDSASAKPFGAALSQSSANTSKSKGRDVMNLQIEEQTGCEIQNLNNEAPPIPFALGSEKELEVDNSLGFNPEVSTAGEDSTVLLSNKEQPEVLDNVQLNVHDETSSQINPPIVVEESQNLEKSTSANEEVSPVRKVIRQAETKADDTTLDPNLIPANPLSAVNKESPMTGNEDGDDGDDPVSNNENQEKGNSVPVNEEYLDPASLSRKKSQQQSITENDSSPVPEPINMVQAERSVDGQDSLPILIDTSATQQTQSKDCVPESIQKTSNVPIGVIETTENVVASGPENAPSPIRKRNPKKVVNRATSVKEQNIESLPARRTRSSIQLNMDTTLAIGVIQTRSSSQISATGDDGKKKSPRSGTKTPKKGSPKNPTSNSSQDQINKPNTSQMKTRAMSQAEK